MYLLKKLMPYPARFLFTIFISLAVAIPALAQTRRTPHSVNRINVKVDAAKMHSLTGQTHHLAQPQHDQGLVDPAMRMERMMLMVRPSAGQQTDLDALLADLQNPSSRSFHQWLTPEEFGERFGLTNSDLSKVVAWLAAEGFDIKETARGKNWIAFSGTAGQVAKSLHTEIHRFQVNGETHYANATDPSIPEALADVVSGVNGLDDFRLRSMAMKVPPDYTSGTSHYLVPEDFATIYNLTPLYQAGLDGTGVGIAIVGESDVVLSDLAAFKTRYGLPANVPALLPYSTDPGFNGAEIEGVLDLEWSSAIAPKAKVTYVYGPSAFGAMVAAVNQNVAPVMSVSYGGCESGYRVSYYRSIGQQANAQGITIMASSGDSGAAGCDPQGVAPFATGGQIVDFPAVLPEVTAVGGTMFVEGSGTWWNTANDANFGSAMSYIPEAAWNESSDTMGLGSSGGGTSLFFPRPVWQTGSGVPNDNARHIPDIAFSASVHDGYEISISGSNIPIGGTSASSPSMAGVVALLNQYVVSKGFQTKPGLGNINPQLYRLAQSAPSIFHDIVSLDNIVRCQQGSPDCLAGSFGYHAAAGYDQATGLGSMDVNALVTQWNTATHGVTVTVTAPARGTVNDTVQISATVAAAGGSAVPTGSVDFSYNGIPLGSGKLVNGQTQINATLGSLLVTTGTVTVFAQYSGDTAFSSGGASARIQITAPPAGTAAVLVSAPNTVWPNDFPDAQGASWQTAVTLVEANGVPALVTGLTIDGQAQTLSQYLPSPELRASGSLTANFVFRGLTAPLTRTFVFTGTDAGGNSWARQVQVVYEALPNSSQNFKLTATPLVVTQNPSADPSCQWAVQLNIDDLGGVNTSESLLHVGNVDRTADIPSIFGTVRNDAFGGQQGVLCIPSPAAQGSEYIEVDRTDGLTQETLVTLTGPPVNPTKLSAAPATLAMATQGSSQTAQATLAVGIADKTQAWSASIFPANRTTSWLTLSQTSGVGPATITLTANGAGFEPAAYRATITIQSTNAVPQVLNVPVMFVLGGSPSISISGIGNAASFQPIVSPGSLAAIFGANLSNTTGAQPGSITAPFPLNAGGVSVTVNGLNAPLLYLSPGQINIQIPYRAGAGPAVLTVNNNGQVAGFQFTITPSAPAFYVDSSGAPVGAPSVSQGGTIATFINGAGEITPATKSGYVSTTSSISASAKPLLPLSVTVGGVPAYLTYVGISTGLIGTMQINFTVPASVPAGVQPLVVTVGNLSSPPAQLTVKAGGN
jgi:uncharacterized protein (TIGR03437 family)